jgi:hypothetical protein
LSTKEEVIRLIKNMPNNVTTEEIIKELYAKLKLDREIQENLQGGSDTNKRGNRKVGKWLH